MTTAIKPKRSTVAGLVPTTSNLAQYEFAINTADKKSYVSDGTNVIQVSAANLSGLADAVITSPTDGQYLTYNSAISKWNNTDANFASTGKAIAMAIVFGG